MSDIGRWSGCARIVIPGAATAWAASRTLKSAGLDNVTFSATYTAYTARVSSQAS